MKKITNLFTLAVFVLTIAFAALPLTGCDGGAGNDPDDHVHVWGWEITTPATEIEDGLKTEICSECGEKSGRTEVIEKISGGNPGGNPGGDPGDTPKYGNPKTNEDFIYVENGVSVIIKKYIGTKTVVNVGRIEDLPVISIDANAFDGRYTVTSVTLPNTVTNIGDGAFSMCLGLESITIPDGVKSIGVGAFNLCGLTSVTIPDSVTSIGYQAFTMCTDLQTVTIGSGVTSMGDSVFYLCGKLSAINVNSANTAYCSVDGVLYTKNQTTLIHYPKAKTDTSFFIPNSVIRVETEAFFACDKLTSITIPYGVTSIGYRAFRGTGVTNVVIPDSVTTLDAEAFFASGAVSVTIGSGVTSLEYAVFGNCTNLVSIIIPATVTAIKDEAFTSCTKLASVTFQGEIAAANFNSSAFSTGYNSLRTVYFGAGGGAGTYILQSGALWTKQTQ